MKFLQNILSFLPPFEWLFFKHIFHLDLVLDPLLLALDPPLLALDPPLLLLTRQKVVKFAKRAEFAGINYDIMNSNL